MADVDIQRYLDDIESQHASKPKYMAHMTALLEKVDDATQVIKEMPTVFDIYSAVGQQLDILGEIVGIDRRHSIVDLPDASELLDDKSFRLVILTKIIQNQWDGTGEKFQEIWNSAFGTMIESSWHDNQDMTIDLSIVGDIPYDLVLMIQRGYYLPKPMGVGMNITVINRDYAGIANAWVSTGVVSIGGRIEATAINSDMEV